MGNLTRGPSLSNDLFFIFFILTVVISLANGAQLKIKPEGAVLVKPVDQDFFLICSLEGDDPNRITDLQWLTPNNETIPVHGIERYGMKLSTQWAPNKSLLLVIPSLKEAGAGTYTCTGLYGTERLSEAVTVKTFVDITWQDCPLEQFPTLNKDYKVKCKVIANPSPYVDWLKNDDKIETDDHYIIEADGLLIKNAQESDDGIYTCRAYIADTGSMIKRNIKVEVHIKPVFNSTKNYPILEVIEGETIDITCHASGKPPPSYTWIKSSRKANLGIIGDRFNVNDQTGTLTINPVKPDDNGELVCEAKNAAGFDSQNFNLIVLVKPSVYEIKNISVATGNTAILECRATGNPLPSVTFRKLSSTKTMKSGAQGFDSRIVVEQRVDETKREVIGSLIVANLQRSDDGLYACIAKNKGGEAIKNGHLTVEFAPTFVNTPMKEAWSWDRRPVNLTCLAESIPNATITWRFNERPLLEGNPYFRQFGVGPQSSLLVTPSSPEYYTNYKCEAKNTIGTAYHTIRLLEAHPPGRILQSKLGVHTATTISFTFVGPSEIGGRPIKAYVAQYKQERQSWAEAKNRTWSFDSPYILEHLEPQTTYNFRFAAVNEVGIGPFGGDHQHTMLKRSYPEEPKIIVNPSEEYITSPYSDRFELRWKVPADNGEPIDYYDIKCCVAEKSNDKWHAISENCLEKRASGNIASYDLKDLSADTHYKVEVRAHNLIGYSTPGEAVLKTALDPRKSNKYSLESASASSKMMFQHSIVSISSLSVFVMLLQYCE